ncbi:MAG: hypothetical protein WAP47_03910 [Candidatus Rokuibacteriota bacterium]
MSHESLIGPLSYPAINTTLWSLGSLQRVSLGSPILLVADVVNGALESRYSALREPNAAGGYQVTAGKTLWILKSVHACSAAGGLWLLGSGTADAGDSQVAAPAGAVSEDSRADGISNPYVATAALTIYEHDLLVAIAATLYPFLRSITPSNTMRALFIGVEL